MHQAFEISLILFERFCKTKVAYIVLKLLLKSKLDEFISMENI